MTNWEVITGDCLDVLRGMADNSIDAIVTDPPAGIAFMGKEWDKHKGGRSQWIEWMTAVMSECSRVLKPGGHALVWALPRTAHWTATAVEDAGLEIREKCYHIFGSGFPKSLDVGKAIDKAAGVEREVIGVDSTKYRRDNNGNNTYAAHVGQSGNITAPTTPAARQWDGWGTALKPAVEEWILARKPLIGTVAQNVQEWGTGGINIDGCRVPHSELSTFEGKAHKNGHGGDTGSYSGGFRRIVDSIPSDRWPANLIHDGSPEVLAGFPVTTSNGGKGPHHIAATEARNNNRAAYSNYGASTDFVYGDTGSAARFFYCAKASKADRDEGLEGFEEKEKKTLNDYKSPSEGRIAPKNGTPRANNHPTVKNTTLMRYLCRLITPPGGLILDPFTGSGSTGKAAMLEGFSFVGVEQDEDYADIARARITKAAEQARQLEMEL
jgi:DNA modification methylase